MKINNIIPDKQSFLARLTKIPNPPESLNYIGALPNLSSPVIAIVGTRRPTSYGRAVTEQLASAVASRSGVVVSGLALGVDGIAHTSALSVNGKTVAILPGGVDNPYPRSHHGLARKILDQGGALISEFANGHSPHQYDFLKRNRLVSGLADALVVTEATLRSGTMSTVTHALEQGINIYAVPGPITSSFSAGCNRLIAQGATPITSIDDFLELIGMTGQTKMTLPDNDAEATLLQLLQEGISDGDELLETSKLTSTQFFSALSMLEIKGVVKPLGGNQWRL